MNVRKLALIFGAGMTIFVSAMFFMFTVSEPIVNDAVQKIIMEERHPFLAPLADATPGDVSAFLTYMVYPHDATPDTTYASNLSNATAYEFSDIGNTTCQGETPYSTTFDLVVKVQATNEDGYFTGNQSRSDGYVWCHLTCADLGIGADTNMTEVFMTGINSTETVYYTYYLNNAGAGYTITEGQDFNVTSVKFYVQRIV